MITLHTFGPMFGLPDASPFVTKAMLLLSFSGLPFVSAPGGLGRAPKCKLPYIDDDGVRVADSTFIRLHLERRYGIDFDAGLSERERAVAWAIEKMCEEHLYWAIIDARWGDPANFARGPRRFFDGMPRPIRPLVARMVRGRVLAAMRGQGFGRHARAEIEALAIRDLAALAAILGDRPFLMGTAPCGADASVFGFVAAVLAPVFDTPIRTAAERLPSLVAYRDRTAATYFDGSARRTPPDAGPRAADERVDRGGAAS